MKTLLLMRHAKSSWADPGMADHDRPLNKRGKRDAPRMGVWLAERKLTPDLIISSSAKRARKTAELVAEACGYEGELVIVPELYHATPQIWMGFIQKLPQSASRPLCIGHNPGLEEVLASWTGNDVEMSTAAIARLALNVDTWAGFNSESAVSLEGLQRPKELDGK